MGKKSRKSKQKDKRKGGGATPSAAASPALPSPQAPAAAAAEGKSAVIGGNSASPPPGAVCWICLDGDANEGEQPIVRDCSCRGDDAGFVHLTCLVCYAGTKTKELFDKGGDANLVDPWQTCPTCKQGYQRQLAIDMAKSCVTFIGENYPNCPRMKIWKLDGFTHLLNKIKDMGLGNLDLESRSAWRDEGKRVAYQMISEIERMDDITRERYGDQQLEDRKVWAFGVIGNFAAAEHTKEGYDLALRCFKKVQACLPSGSEAATAVELRMKMIKAKRDGKRDFSLTEEGLKDARLRYEHIMRENGESAAHAAQRIGSGLALANYLIKARRGLELQRLLNDLEVDCHRVLGPDHPFAEQIEFGLKKSRQRAIGVMFKGRLTECRALGFNKDTGTYNVEGNLPIPGIYQVRMSTFEIGRGTPVICHGLENAQHLNGKIGEVIRRDNGAGRYEVRFEDKNTKPASVKDANLRILFDLPDKQ